MNKTNVMIAGKRKIEDNYKDTKYSFVGEMNKFKRGNLEIMFFKIGKSKQP